MLTKPLLSTYCYICFNKLKRKCFVTVPDDRRGTAERRRVGGREATDVGEALLSRPVPTEALKRRAL